MADVDDPDLSVLDRRVRHALQLDLGALPSAESPTKSVIGSEESEAFDHSDDEDAENEEEGATVDLRVQSQGKGRAWGRRQTLGRLRQSVGSEDRTAIPITPKPPRTIPIPSRQSAIHIPSITTPSTTTTDSAAVAQDRPTVPEPALEDSLPSLPTDGDFDQTTTSAMPDRQEASLSIVIGETSTISPSRTIQAHVRPNSTPIDATLARQQPDFTDNHPAGSDSGEAGENSSNPDSSLGSGVYASTPIDQRRKTYRRSEAETPGPSSSASPDSGGQTYTSTQTRAVPPSALRSSVRMTTSGNGNGNGANVDQASRNRRKVSVSFDVPAIGHARWSGSGGRDEADVEENEGDASGRLHQSGLIQGGEGGLMEYLEEEAEAYDGAGTGGSRGSPKSPEEDHDISNSSRSANGDILADELSSSPSDADQHPPRAFSPNEDDQERSESDQIRIERISSIKYRASGGEMEQGSEDGASSDGSGMIRERAVDLIVPLRDDDEGSQVYGSQDEEEKEGPSHGGAWMDTRPRHRFPPHAPASPYPNTPRRPHAPAHKRDSTTTDPLGAQVACSNRIPSLSHSSDHSGSTSRSGSESSFERDLPTPGLPQGDFSTPVREVSSYAGRTPGGVSLRPDLDDVDEVEEEHVPYDSNKFGDSSAIAKDKTHHTVSSQWTSPGQARHLSRAESERQMSLLMGEESDQEGTPVRADHGLEKEHHARAILGDMTGTSNGVMSPSPFGAGAGILIHTTPKADKQSAMSRHLISTLNASAMKSRQPRTSVLSRIGGRARRERLSSAGTVSSAGDASAIGSGSLAFGAGSMSALGFQTSRYGQFGDDGGSSAGDMSVLSVTSSADLTTDKRASSARARGNTSVPAVMPSDINAPDAPVNKAKLLKHVYSVNKALTDEMQALRELLNGERAQNGKSPVQPGSYDRAAAEEQSTSRFDQDPYRSRVGLASPARSDVTSDLVTELKAINEDLEQACAAKDAELAALAAQLEARSGDRDHIAELEGKLAELEQLDDEHLAEVDALRDEIEDKKSVILAKEATIDQMERNFAEQMAVFSADFGKLMEEEKTKYDDQLKQKAAELQEARWAVTALESEKERLRKVMDTDTLEEKERALQDQLRDQADELFQKNETLSRHHREGEALRDQITTQGADNDTLRSENERLNESRQDADRRERQSAEQRQAMEVKLNAAEEEAADLRNRVDKLDIELQDIVGERDGLGAGKAEMGELLENLNEKLVQSKDRAASLLAEANSLRTQNQELTDQLARAEHEIEEASRASQTSRQEPSDLETATVSNVDRMETQGQPSDLQAKLADAERTAAKNSSFVRASPTPRHQSALEAKELRITALQQENKALAERVRSLQVQAAVFNGPQGRNSSGNTFGSPLVHKRLLKLQDPKTPGSIPDASWLDTSMGYEAVAFSPNQVALLMEELQGANDRLDGNIQNLGDANLVVYSLAERLAQAEEQKAELELRLHQHSASDADLRDRLSRLQCPECEVVVDGNAALDPTLFGRRQSSGLETRSDRDVQELKQTIVDVRLRHEKLQADAYASRVRLQQRISDLEGKLRTAADAVTAANTNRHDSEVTAELLQKEVDRQTADLKRSTSNIERLGEDLARADRLRDEQVKRSEAIDKQLAAALKTEREGRRRVHQLQREMEAFQAKRAPLPVTTQDPEVGLLRTQLARLNEQLTDTRADLRESKEIRKELEQTLRARVSEIESSQAASRSASADLERACADLRKVESALRTTQTDARRLQDVIERLGSRETSLDSLRQELSALKRGRKDAERLIASLESELADKERTISKHQQNIMDQGFKLVDVRDRSELQTRGDNLLADRRKLTAQLRFINARYTRENTFRRSLQGQKDYLLCLVGKFKQTERATLSVIASMGFPTGKATSRQRPTLKGAAVAVRAIVRMRHLAEAWREAGVQRP